MTQVPKLFEVIYALGWAVRQLKAFEAQASFHTSWINTNMHIYVLTKSQNDLPQVLQLFEVYII